MSIDLSRRKNASKSRDQGQAGLEKAEIASLLKGHTWSIPVVHYFIFFSYPLGALPMQYVSREGKKWRRPRLRLQPCSSDFDCIGQGMHNIPRISFGDSALFFNDRVVKDVRSNNDGGHFFDQAPAKAWLGNKL